MITLISGLPVNWLYLWCPNAIYMYLEYMYIFNSFEA